MPDVVEPSIRGLRDSGQWPGYPLTKFYGVLESYPPEDDQFGTKRINLNYVDVEVLDSVEVYPFPIATVALKLSNQVMSAWGIFAQSLAGCIPDDEDLKDQVGKKIGMEYTPDHDYGFKDASWVPNVDGEGNALNEEERPNVIRSAWEVFEVEGSVAGAAAMSPEDKLKEILNGKNRADFNKAAMTDPLIKTQGQAFIKEHIISKAFVTKVIESGEFTEDENGVFHKADRLF